MLCAHLGHARSHFSTNIILCILKIYFRFDVRFMMNIADVDDKLIEWARRLHSSIIYKDEYTKITPEEIAFPIAAYASCVSDKLPQLKSVPATKNLMKGANKSYGAILDGGFLLGDRVLARHNVKFNDHGSYPVSAFKTIN